MGWIAIAAQVAGAVYQGMAANAQAESAQNMSKYNAQLALRNKAQIEARGKQESIQQAKEASRQSSSLLAKIGASGAVAQAGTPLDIMAEQAVENEMENLAIGYDTQVAAQQQESQAELDIMQGDIARQRGRMAAGAAYMGAGSSVLSGFGGGGRSVSGMTSKTGVSQRAVPSNTSNFSSRAWR